MRSRATASPLERERPRCLPNLYPESLVSRVPLVRIEDMTPEQRAQYERFPSNLTRGLLLAEQRLASALPVTANALRTSGLDPKLREGALVHNSDCGREAPAQGGFQRTRWDTACQG